MGFVRFKLKEGGTIFDCFVNERNIAFISNFIENDHVYTIGAFEFQTEGGERIVKSYEILEDTMGTIAKKLGLEGK